MTAKRASIFGDDEFDISAFNPHSSDETGLFSTFDSVS
jgi:hypothetical protein